MKPQPQKVSRCAIYTRKSTDHNLELEFNSLDAQREACEAYIKSQAHEGWRLIPDHYDDGGLSGASLERPALQQLLKDIQAKKVDIIVVYKVDRLTRSLADFAKLVELFDENTVSFVSITQSFNTTTSMGRLTLNVLLSFAQFEREVIGERVRDKIAASKKKGIWVGGPIPMGYRSVEKKLVIEPIEAAKVRLIYQRYLDLKSIHALQLELDTKDIRTQIQVRTNGTQRGGCRFGKGTLYHLLKNRFYIGDVAYKGAIHAGEHEPVIARETFNAVQTLLSRNGIERKIRTKSTAALLTGLLFDDRGNRMTPSFSKKNGVRYRYYISHALLQARKQDAGTISRVPADQIEQAVISALGKHESSNIRPTSLSPDEIRQQIDRVVVSKNTLEISRATKGELDDDQEQSETKPTVLTVSWRRNLTIAPKGVHHNPPDQASIAPETRDALLKAIAKARKWIADIQSGAVGSFSEIAEREQKVERHIRLLAPLAFAPPNLIRAIEIGTVDPTITVTGLAKGTPYDWTMQVS